jgi:hypothetical protein
LERFSLNNLNREGGSEPNQVTISNSSSASENLADDVDSNRAWESVIGNINISAEGS